MGPFLPTDPDTLEDQRLYTEARLVEVACLDCLARVRVKKNSDHHTSVQWSQQALADCQEFNRNDAEGRQAQRPVHRPCSRLRASIDRAVEAGEVPVGAEDGY